MRIQKRMKCIINALSFTNSNRCATSGNTEHMQRIYNNHHNKLLRMREILKEYQRIEGSLRDDVKDIYNADKD